MKSISKDAKVYADQILLAVPRLLSGLDREETSPTYGCFDREFWAWATKEFANVDLQRGVFPLAFLWSTNFPGNIYFNNEKIKRWILAGFEYWITIQHKDGSFDHLYPNEHSVVGTGFPLFELCNAFEIISPTLSKDIRLRILFYLKKAGNFLLSHDEFHGFISNHRAGFACALYKLSKLSGKEQYAVKARAIILEIKDKQSSEGWFFEYSGADPGYQTLDTHYLSQYFFMADDPAVFDMLVKSLGFLVYFVQPDGTIGGEYGSRTTEIYYPGGFELLSRFDANAAAISSFMRQSINQLSVVHLTSMDIRNFVPFLSSYCVALRSTMDRVPSVHPARLPFTTSLVKYFPEAGFYLFSNKKAYVVMSVDKGIIRVYKHGSLFFCNSGYFGTLKNGKPVSTQMRCGAINISVVGSRIDSSLRFFKVPLRMMTHKRFVLFRLFNMTIGRFGWINDLVRRYVIVRFFIAPTPKPVGIMLRHVTIIDDRLSIHDSVVGKMPLASLKPIEKFTTIFMASARYFQPSDLSVGLSSKDFTLDASAKNISFDYSINLD